MKILGSVLEHLIIDIMNEMCPIVNNSVVNHEDDHLMAFIYSREEMLPIESTPEWISNVKRLCSQWILNFANIVNYKSNSQYI